MPDLQEHTTPSRWIYSELVDGEDMFQEAAVAMSALEARPEVERKQEDDTEYYLIGKDNKLLAKRYYHPPTGATRIVIFKQEDHPIPLESWPGYDPDWRDKQ